MKTTFITVTTKPCYRSQGNLSKIKEVAAVFSHSLNPSVKLLLPKAHAQIWAVGEPFEKTKLYFSPVMHATQKARECSSILVTVQTTKRRQNLPNLNKLPSTNSLSMYISITFPSLIFLLLLFVSVPFSPNAKLQLSGSTWPNLKTEQGLDSAKWSQGWFQKVMLICNRAMTRQCQILTREERIETAGLLCCFAQQLFQNEYYHLWIYKTLCNAPVCISVENIINQ